ncbi:hypothetical protein IT570_12305 [Candidatus Sumerlaeota bacterium]|nr:hypothetical protein [Candidatus Sumerlaeota bacterium]
MAFLRLALRPAPGTAATMRLPGGTFFIPLELSPTDKALALRIGNGARGDGFIAARFDPSVEANGFNTLMTEAPASGYQSELVIPPGDYFRDPEKKLYFFIKSGSYFGKGSLSRISYQNIPGKCEVLRAEVRIHFATDQQRKLITRGL